LENPATGPERMADLLRRSSISAIIGNTVELSHIDRLRGRCPRHPDPTHSLYVEERLSIFHCFGCGLGGDTIRWIELFHQLNHDQAVEWLARRATDQSDEPGS